MCFGRLVGWCVNRLVFKLLVRYVGKQLDTCLLTAACNIKIEYYVIFISLSV